MPERNRSSASSSRSCPVQRRARARSPEWRPYRQSAVPPFSTLRRVTAMKHSSHLSMKHAVSPILCRLGFVLVFHVSVAGRRTDVRHRPDHALLVVLESVRAHRACAARGANMPTLPFSKTIAFAEQVDPVLAVRVGGILACHMRKSSGRSLVARAAATALTHPFRPIAFRNWYFGRLWALTVRLLVTGGASGLGRAIALGAARRGATVPSPTSTRTAVRRSPRPAEGMRSSLI